MIVVGCPVFDRAWILDQWFDHIQEAAFNAGLANEIIYAFVGDRERDPATWKIIDERCGIDEVYEFGKPAPVAAISRCLEAQVPEFKPNDTRYWDYPRYQRMSDLRNQLLRLVRSMQPDYFFSVDSDILVHPDQFKELIGVAREEEWDAVGGKVYLSKTGYRAPSYAMVSRQGALQRRDYHDVRPVHVIMAVKLMTPKAYAVDYIPDTQGEDTGWGFAARSAGLRVGWTGRVCSKHIFERRLLDVPDRRVGW